MTLNNCYNHKCICIVLSIIFLNTCSLVDDDLSSPEKTIATYYRAIDKKDHNLFSKCFYSKSKSFTKESLRSLSNVALSKTVKIRKYKIVTKNIVSEDEVVFDIEDSIERYFNNNYPSHYFKSRTSVNLIKVGNNWKITSSKIISFEEVLVGDLGSDQDK